MDKEITLTQAIFGMGNANHDHVHRNNTFNPSPMVIDTLKMEQYNGGIRGTTLNQLAAQAGSLSAQPSGMVSIEDGWNIRRGIGLLRFHVTGSVLEEKQLSVLGYLTGGEASPEGIASETMFVPVRSWELSTRQKQDNMGLPMASTAIVNSNQFLLGDPYHMKQLRAVRPTDVAVETLGMLAATQDGTPVEQFDGLLGSDLSATIVTSKTQNLNPTHHARELLRVAAGTKATVDQIGIENAFSDTLAGPGLAESPVSENEFARTMMWAKGSTHMMRGFQGWSIGEINEVFQTFPDVLNLQLLEPTNFGNVNNLLDSRGFGEINDYEIIASEAAMMTVHLLMQVGLTHLHFSATNNPHDFQGIVGSETGVGWVVGEFGSVLDYDSHAEGRIEQFKTLMEAQFFAKYASGYVHNSVIMSMTMKCSIFGETSIEIFFNGQSDSTRRFVQATYCLSRTSTNISANGNTLAEARNFMQNIREHFSS